MWDFKGFVTPTMRRTRLQTTLAMLFVLAGVASGVRVELKYQELYGIVGRPLRFQAQYIEGTWRDIHSVTWKVQRGVLLRIFQYVMEMSSMYVSPAYEERVEFSRESGSLVLFNFTAGDVGAYRVTVTDTEGAEQTDSARVKVYEQISRPVLATFQTPSYVKLRCSSSAGTEPIYRWLKDGVMLVVNNQSVLSQDGRELSLLAQGTALCGDYTCLVSNQLNRESANQSLSESDGLHSCGKRPISNQRFFYTSLVAIGIIVASLLAIGICLRLRAAKARLL
uniref:hepatic and glial cell adhesion molecule-like n=1 Tax=Pristiophorus japonicus TaxID=55135 RepID=UPI00398EEFCB